MSKAILVIDMPSSCSMCWQTVYCQRWNDEPAKWRGYNNRLDGCPLKLIRRKGSNKPFDTSKPSDMEKVGYISGWNDCVDELLGDEE